MLIVLWNLSSILIFVLNLEINVGNWVLALRVELYLVLLADAAIQLKRDAVDCSEAELEVEVMVWTIFF